MALLKDIETQLVQAMRDKAVEKLSVLRMLKSGVKNAAIEKGGADYTPTDAEVVAVVRKEIKKRQDSIESFVKAGREELADKEKRELAFLETYLPAGLSEAELEAIVKAAISEAGATSKAQMGAVMKLAQAKAAGRADGKVLSALVQKLLPA
jgi:uncharacterized protein YqeY